MTEPRQVIWSRPERATRGPTPSLSRPQIAAAAVALADARGIEAVSMRAVAAELGVGAASLYRYVDRRDELVDLMVDAVIGSDLQFEIGRGWREDLRGLGRALRAMALRHPWIAVQRAGMRSFGPHAADYHERALTAVDGLGLEIDDMLVMIETLDAYVRGRAVDELTEQDAVRRSGLDQDAHMQTQLPWMQSLVESGEYPQLTRLVIDARSPHDPDRLENRFEVGLELVLDGLAAMVAPGP